MGKQRGCHLSCGPGGKGEGGVTLGPALVTTPRPRVREELAHRNWKRSFRSCSSIAEMEKSPQPEVPECPGLGTSSHWRNWALAPGAQSAEPYPGRRARPGLTACGCGGPCLGLGLGGGSARWEPLGVSA